MPYSENLLRFMGENYDLPIVTDDGVFIDFIEGRMKQNWIEIVIRVNEYTTRKSLENAYPLIDKWRKRLESYQGLWVGGGDNELYEWLFQMHKHGDSYNELANRLNNQIAQYVKEHHHNPYAQERAIWIMQAMGINESDAKQWFTYGVENIENGNSPFMQDEPITGQYGQVRERIRAWEKKRLEKDDA